MEPLFIRAFPNFLIYQIPTVEGIIPSKLIETLSVSREMLGIDYKRKSDQINIRFLCYFIWLEYDCRALKMQSKYIIHFRTLIFKKEILSWLSDINSVKMLDNKEIYKDVSERHPLCCSQELTLFGMSFENFFPFYVFPQKNMCVCVWSQRVGQYFTWCFASYYSHLILYVRHVSK